MTAPEQSLTKADDTTRAQLEMDANEVITSIQSLLVSINKLAGQLVILTEAMAAQRNHAGNQAASERDTIESYIR